MDAWDDDALVLRKAQDAWDAKRAAYLGMVHTLFRGGDVPPGHLAVAAAELQQAMDDFVTFVQHAQSRRRLGR